MSHWSTGAVDTKNVKPYESKATKHDMLQAQLPSCEIFVFHDNIECTQKSRTANANALPSLIKQRNRWWKKQKKSSATRARTRPSQLEQRLHRTTKAKASLNTNFQRHQSTMISHMKADYFTQANEVAALYALLPEWYGLSSTQTQTNISVGPILWTMCSTPKDYYKDAQHTKKDEQHATIGSSHADAGQRC